MLNLDVGFKSLVAQCPPTLRYFDVKIVTRQSSCHNTLVSQTDDVLWQ